VVRGRAEDLLIDAKESRKAGKGFDFMTTTYELMTLMDPEPFLGGGVVTVPETWRAAGKEGWELVSVAVMLNGTRVGYFQRVKDDTKRVTVEVGPENALSARAAESRRAGSDDRQRAADPLAAGQRKKR